LLQSQVQVAPGLFGSLQFLECVGRQGCDIGIRNVHELQQAQCSIMVSIVKQQQAAINRRKYLGIRALRAPEAINQANGRQCRVLLQGMADVVKMAGQVAAGARKEAGLQRAQRGIADQKKIRPHTRIIGWGSCFIKRYRSSTTTNASISAFMRRVGRRYMDALERDRRVSTVQTDVRVSVAHGHINMAVQVSQGLAFQVQLVMASNKILDDIGAGLMVSKVRRHMTRAAGRIAACAVMRDQRMSTADEIRVVGSARHRRAVTRNVISEMCTGSTAGIHQRVMARTQVNGVVTSLMMSTESLAVRLTATV